MSKKANGMLKLAVAMAASDKHGDDIAATTGKIVNDALHRLGKAGSDACDDGVPVHPTLVLTCLILASIDHLTVEHGEQIALKLMIDVLKSSKLSEHFRSVEIERPADGVH